MYKREIHLTSSFIHSTIIKFIYATEIKISWNNFKKSSMTSCPIPGEQKTLRFTVILLLFVNLILIFTSLPQGSATLPGHYPWNSCCGSAFLCLLPSRVFPKVVFWNAFPASLPISPLSLHLHATFQVMSLTTHGLI